MTNIRWTKIIILMVAVVFISTTVYAKSNKSDAKTYAKSWWHMSYYQMKKAAKEAVALQKKISKLQHKTDKLEQKKKELEEDLVAMKKEIELLSGNRSSINNGEVDKDPRVICPGCYFAESEEFDGYDFSNAFLNRAYFNDALLNRTNFSNAMLKKAYFIGAELNEADFSGANLTGANFCGANLAGAKIDGADLTGVQWFDKYYGDAVCPDNTFASEHDSSSCTSPLLSNKP